MVLNLTFIFGACGSKTFGWFSHLGQKRKEKMFGYPQQLTQKSGSHFFLNIPKKYFDQYEPTMQQILEKVHCTIYTK